MGVCVFDYGFTRLTNLCESVPNVVEVGLCLHGLNLCVCVCVSVGV